MEITKSIDHRLLLELRAERETREAILDAAQAGADSVVLEAIASDPIPVEAVVFSTLEEEVHVDRAAQRRAVGRSPRSFLGYRG